MGLGTLTARVNGQTIDESWYNQFRNAMMIDQYPRNASGIATDQAGSLGTSSYRWLNAYLMYMYLYNGTRYIRQKSPSGMSADYDVEWPGALPGSTLPLQMSSGGIMTFAQLPAGGIASDAITTVKILDQNVTQAKLQARTSGTGAGNISVSSSSSSFTSNSGTAVDVTNLTCTLTTTGRPVFIVCQPDGSLGPCGIANTSLGSWTWSILRGGTTLTNRDVLSPIAGTSYDPPPYLDVVGAGTYTWKIQVTPNGHNINVTSYVLICFEI